MANFFTDEIFTCSCGSMLFEEKETKSFKLAGKRLINHTKMKSLKCKSCKREYMVNENDEVMEQA